MIMNDYSGDSLRRQFLGPKYMNAARKADEALADIFHDQRRALLMTKGENLRMAFRDGQEVIFGGGHPDERSQIGAAYTEADGSVTYESLGGNDFLREAVIDHLLNGGKVESRDLSDDRRRTRRSY